MIGDVLPGIPRSCLASDKAEVFLICSLGLLGRPKGLYGQWAKSYLGFLGSVWTHARLQELWALV